MTETGNKVVKLDAAYQLALDTIKSALVQAESTNQAFPPPDNQTSLARKMHMNMIKEHLAGLQYYMAMNLLDVSVLARKSGDLPFPLKS